eukprot:COSAG02_NODE_10964_length_1823_cov_1.247100_1_plen_346_part_00
MESSPPGPSPTSRLPSHRVQYIGPTEAASPAQGSLDAARRQADAIAAEANRKLQTLSLGATPTQAAPRPAGAGEAASSMRSPIRDLMDQESAEMRLALASRRHADSSAAAARVNSALSSSPHQSSPRVDALTQHAMSARDNWGASPRALANHGVMMSEVSSSPRSAIGGRGTPRTAGLASPRQAMAGSGSPRIMPATEVEAVHRAQQDLSAALRSAGAVAASPTAFRSKHEPERRQHIYVNPYRPAGPAAVGKTEKSNGGARITALQAKADLAANKLANMLPARPMDAGAPIAYARYAATTASGSPRPMQQAGFAAPTATGPGSPGTSFSSEMARSPGAIAYGYP